MTERLKDFSGLPSTVRTPGYKPADHAAGILHLGLGAFHRAHQAVATDDALAAEGGDWRIIGANLRSRDVAQAITEQNGLYTVLVRGQHDEARVIAAHAAAIGGDTGRILHAACDPAIRILSLTVSEKAYAVDRATMDLDTANPVVAADLADSNNPSSVPGLLVAALAHRHAHDVAPFTLLSCDNLPHNGRLLKAAVLGFARRTRPELAAWIEAEVAFPSTMVDRITPASTEKTFADVRSLIGREDRAAVETEPFSQWVIEDHFPQGRPAWEAGGAQIVSDPQPYEDMKLRMLNGSHSLIAYGGQLLGHPYVRDAVADAAFLSLIRRHMQSAAATLPATSGLDPRAYEAALLQRFANPAIAHATAQIAKDCTEKLPQRWFAPATLLRAKGDEARAFSFALATWMAWLAGATMRGDPIGDIREEALKDIVRSHTGDEKAMCQALLRFNTMGGKDLPKDATFTSSVATTLKGIMRDGYRQAVLRELGD
jgi:fructuronate reductase